MSKPDRAAQSRRHLNHANARAALEGRSLRRVQSTSQLDGRTAATMRTPSQPTAVEWNYGANNVWAQADQAREKAKGGSRRPKFSLFKSSSQQNLKTPSLHRAPSKVVWLVPEGNQNQASVPPQKDNKPYELPMPRSSSKRNTQLNPDRPPSLAASVCNAVGMQPSKTGRGGREESVKEQMDRLQPVKNTSFQGRVREVQPEHRGTARAHEERLARLKSAREVQKNTPPALSVPQRKVETKRIAGTPSVVSTMMSAAMSDVPIDSPAPQKLAFTLSNSSDSKPQRSPSVKPPASYAPKANSVNARRVTTLEFPSPDQSLPNSPTFSLSTIFSRPFDDNDDDSTDNGEEYDMFDEKVMPPMKSLRRFASESDLTAFNDAESMDTIIRRQDTTGRFGRLYHGVLKQAQQAIREATAAGLGPPPRSVSVIEDGILLPPTKPLQVGKRVSPPDHSVNRKSEDVKASRQTGKQGTASPAATPECVSGPEVAGSTEVKQRSDGPTAPSSGLPSAKVQEPPRPVVPVVPAVTQASIMTSATPLADAARDTKTKPSSQTSVSTTPSNAKHPSLQGPSHSATPLAPSAAPSILPVPGIAPDDKSRIPSETTRSTAQTTIKPPTKPAHPSEEHPRAATPSVPAQHTTNKPAEIQRIPSSSARDKPAGATRKVSVKDLVSQFQAHIALAAPKPPMPKPKEMTRSATPAAHSSVREEPPPSRVAVPKPAEETARSSHMENTRQTVLEKKPETSGPSRGASGQQTPSPAPSKLCRKESTASPRAASPATSRPSTPAEVRRLSTEGRQRSTSPRRTMTQADQRARRQGLIAQAEANRRRQPGAMHVKQSPAPSPEAKVLHKTKRRSSRRESVEAEVTYFTLDRNSWNVIEVPKDEKDDGWCR
ncbi:hypothetical protein EIP86_007730 [Pleurotus ostreatoroseus]|nr:hypothetical protein EIP86_007730 [Pleurotus ostreatoroseus]